MTGFWDMLRNRRRRETAGVSEHAARELMSFTGVVSVGLSTDEDDMPVVVVGVQQSSAEILRVLPDKVEGLPVVVREVGEIETRGR